METTIRKIARTNLLPFRMASVVPVTEPRTLQTAMGIA